MMKDGDFVCRTCFFFFTQDLEDYLELLASSEILLLCFQLHPRFYHVAYPACTDYTHQFGPASQLHFTGHSSSSHVDTVCGSSAALDMGTHTVLFHPVHNGVPSILYTGGSLL